jgi:hypothetical protein
MTTDWKEFERYSQWLIRLVWVHDIYRFQDQKGRADGFFKFKNLAVMYDCTLEKDFLMRKKDQIMNFCNQLKSGSIEIGGDVKDISHCWKQVWIITRGDRRVIKKVDEIVVREVPVTETIGFYLRRFEGDLGESEVSSMLTRVD